MNKVRNKKDGSLGHLREIDLLGYVWVKKEDGSNEIYKTLRELNEEWEDANPN